MRTRTEAESSLPDPGGYQVRVKRTVWAAALMLGVALGTGPAARAQAAGSLVIEKTGETLSVGTRDVPAGSFVAIAAGHTHFLAIGSRDPAEQIIDLIEEVVGLNHQHGIVG